MASWKKVVVSGSSAALAALQVDNLTSGQVVIGGGSVGNLSTTAINGTGNILATTGASGVSISGSFSGSFFGNGAGLTGVTATAIFPVTQLTPIVPTMQVFVNDGSNKYATVSQFTSASFAGISGDILVDSAGVATIQPNSVAISTDVSGLGTGVSTALAVNIGTAGSVILNGGALGTPSSGTLTNTTGLPISTGVSGLGTGIATFLATPSSANLAAAVTDETGTGALVFAGSPTFTGTVNFGSLSTTGNAFIGGDLTVAGTASFTNVDNLTVKDKYILINSGSTTLADSGWVTQYNAAGSGSAFYLEASATGVYGRFAMAYDVIGTATALAADEYVVSAKTAAGAPSANPTWGGATNGFGNVYVNSSNGDIYMYS